VGVCHRLAGTARQRPLLLLAAMRPVPHRDGLETLRSTLGPAAVLRVRPLTGDAADALVTELAGAAPGAELRKLAAGAAGNPLYLTELVAALDRAGALTVMVRTVEVTSGAAPAQLAEAIADRLDFLPNRAREAVRAAALLGEDFTAAALASVLRRPVTKLLPALDAARDAGVLVDTGPTLAFRHPLIRAALYDELPATVRAAWHREAAQALDEAEASIETVARQLLAAGPERDPAADSWLLDWLTRSADELTNTTPAVAVALLEPAMRHASVHDPRRHQLAFRLAEALFRRGRHAEAERLATRLSAHLDDPDLLVDAYDLRLRCIHSADKTVEVAAEIERATTTPGLGPIHQNRLLLLAGCAQGMGGDFDAATHLRQLPGPALAAGDHWTSAWAHNARWRRCTAPGRTQRRRSRGLRGDSPLRARNLHCPTCGCCSPGTEQKR
jgi:hypothetical protein